MNSDFLLTPELEELLVRLHAEEVSGEITPGYRAAMENIETHTGECPSPTDIANAITDLTDRACELHTIMTTLWLPRASTDKDDERGGWVMAAQAAKLLLGYRHGVDLFAQGLEQRLEARNDG